MSLRMYGHLGSRMRAMDTVQYVKRTAKGGVGSGKQKGVGDSGPSADHSTVWSCASIRHQDPFVVIGIGDA